MQELLHDLSNLLYPRVCVVCKNQLLSAEKHLCLSCKIKQPHSNFFDSPENAMEISFKGRTHLQQAACLFYFQKQGISQSILHQIKYKKNQALAMEYGKIMGKKILKCSRFKGINYLFPIPMSKEKLKKRGYNQSEILCKGIQRVTGIPLITSTLENHKNEASQTFFNRTSRIFNQKFTRTIDSSLPFIRKHILLVDDVVTTGSTIEFYFHKLNNKYQSKISVAALAFTSNE